MATGDYVAFVDDDDEVSPHYVRAILNAIETHGEPDCIGITGEIRFIKPNGGMRGKKRFYHTITNDHYHESERGFERMPNHLNPIRREIAAKFRFPDKRHGEDTDWAVMIQQAGALRTEIYIDRPLYFYNFNPVKKY